MVAKLWWMIHKDLVSEWRARRAWPSMLLFGTVVALTFGAQIEPLSQWKAQISGSLLWLAIFFAGMLAIDRSFAAEREEGSMDGLSLYPISSEAVFLAKLAVNAIALGALQAVLIPLFIVFCDAPLAAHPWAMLLVAMLGNLGIASVGTLLSALTSGTRHSGSMLALLALPLAIPVLLAASKATQCLGGAQIDADCWRWMQLLGAFAVVFSIAGMLLFDFARED
ncbi:MAG: heme exporter protein CcmB [Pirellulales bacterium]|nr:heme exporter protein CcmB [Pirellulales bacterium]